MVYLFLYCNLECQNRKKSRCRQHDRLQKLEHAGKPGCIPEPRGNPSPGRKRDSHREKGLEESGALRKYFEENILGTEGYPDYAASPEVEEYRGDGTLEREMQREHETIQYLKWLSATYGKTGAEKVWQWLGTKEGRHNALEEARKWIRKRNI